MELDVVLTNQQGVLSSSQYLTVHSLREYNNLIKAWFNEGTLGDDARRIIRETREAFAASEQLSEAEGRQSGVEEGTGDVGERVDERSFRSCADGEAVQKAVGDKE